MSSIVECSLLEMWEDVFEVLVFVGSFLSHQSYPIYNTASADRINKWKVKRYQDIKQVWCDTQGRNFRTCFTFRIRREWIYIADCDCFILHFVDDTETTVENCGGGETTDRRKSKKKFGVNSVSITLRLREILQWLLWNGVRGSVVKKNNP
jgi:hypothetical protein